MPRTRHVVGPVAVGVAALLGAGPPVAVPADDLVRRGNAAFHAGNPDAAEKLYESAEDRTDDPGLVAFNRAAVHFQKGAFRDAEVAYLRALDDAAIPPARRAKALYNRGVCLLKRGGDAGVYKTAIACFDLALDSTSAAAEPGFAADARHNLELAKLLWAQARAKAKSPEKANDPPEDDPEPKPKKQPKPGEDPEVGPGDGPENPVGSQKKQPIPGKNPGGPKPSPTTEPAPGAGSLTVPKDDDRVDPLSPEDTRALLRQIADRLDRDRKSSARGPEWPNVRDW